MVEITPLADADEAATATLPTTAWQERLLDAAALEEAADTLERVSARVHLLSLAKKLRKEGEALRRIMQGASPKEARGTTSSSSSSHPSPSTATTTAAAATASPPKTNPAQAVCKAAAPSVAAAAPPATATATPRYIPIDRFAFDAGAYNSAFVTLYISLPGVGELPARSRDQITCAFTKNSFDLIVRDYGGVHKSYRLFRTHLEKDINPIKSKYIVKPDKIVVKLAKCKGAHGSSYEYWSKLTDPGKALKASSSSKETKADDPQNDIMKLMKSM
jgi:calcyclin binding protein